MLAGCAATIWNHDPESSEEVAAMHQNATRNILNARNAVIAASAQQALETDSRINIPGRAATFFAIGSTVQIADRGRRIGTYRAVHHASSNLVVERGRRLSEWPKVKSMLFLTQNDEQLDRIIDPGVLDGDHDMIPRFDSDPIEIPDGDREHQMDRESTDFSDEFESSDTDEYRLDDVNDNRMIATPKCPIPNTPRGV